MKQERYLYLILAIALILLLVNLNSYRVLEASEARYAEISREMFRSGNLLQPTLLNIFHFHKPPVTFVLTGVGFQLFGVNAFGARFWLQLSLILQGILIYLISQRLFGKKDRSVLGESRDTCKIVQDSPQTLILKRLGSVVFINY